ncbi:MAG TPA: sugar ABC transporter substrate-binding protein [Mycobacteriales bacterium]|nr:sugar ABC transporter substrate-binding protein [Mycobacteriales bacterium]
MIASRRLALALVLLATASVLAACNSTSNGSAGRIKVALLLPETQTTRYESFDKPLFEARLKALCGECDLDYKNANGDKTQQQNQMDAVLANGAKVVVLDPVDSQSAGLLVDKAKARNVPVLSYDRLVANADLDAYVSFDNEKVGRLQAQSLVGKLRAGGTTAGTIVMINGDKADNNALLFNKGAHAVLDTSGFTLYPRQDYWSEWKPANAQAFMESAIAQLGARGFVGVYAANDGTGGGAIAAMRTKGIKPIPPTTGQDAELAAIQRILSGEQFMTVYKAIRPEAEQAAELAVSLARGQAVNPPAKVSNGRKDVPSVLLEPKAVTRDNLKETIFADRFYTAAQVCTGELAQSCGALGIS